MILYRYRHRKPLQYYKTRVLGGGGGGGGHAELGSGFRHFVFWTIVLLMLILDYILWTTVALRHGGWQYTICGSGMI